MSLHIDFETRSDVDIRKHGVYRYMDSPHTAPLFASYKLGDGQVQRWDAAEPCPAAVAAHVAASGTIVAHNAGFERLLWQKILTPRYGWPQVRLEQFQCTAATAAALSLPRDLAGLGAALGLPVQKDNDGYRLIRKFSIPRKPRKDEPPGLYFNTAAEHPEDWEKFKAYCDRDVETEALAHARMVSLSADEQAMWVLSERINDRGMRIDTISLNAALALADKAKAKLDGEITLLTGGYVKSCTQVEELKKWVRSQGVELDSLAKAELEDLLELEDLPPKVRTAIEIRQEAGKTSVSKLEAFRDRVSSDGRVRGAFLYCGAGTGRWCLAEGTRVAVRTPEGVVTEKPIELVGLDDKVWDGTEWVSHDGVVYSGEKEVIEHDGVIATPQHKVFLSPTEYTTLGEAMFSGAPIYRGEKQPT